MNNDRYCDPIPSERELIPRLRGRQWAEEASHLAMLSLDHSSITTVRSLILCSMYWFASGEPDRSHIQSGIASRLVQNLELYNAPDLGAQDEVQELNLRTFWVTWLTEIYATLRRRHNVHPLVEQAINRPLPCSEEEFSSKWRHSNTPFLLKDLDGSGSVLAELMRAADLWYDALFTVLTIGSKLVCTSTDTTIPSERRSWVYRTLTLRVVDGIRASLVYYSTLRKRLTCMLSLISDRRSSMFISYTTQAWRSFTILSS